MRHLNVHIIETGNRYGTMNTSTVKDANQKTPEERRTAFLENRKQAAVHYGFHPLKFYVPSQNKGVPYAILTEEMIAQEEDGWDLDIPADVLIVTDKTPNAVVGYPVADCMVLMMADLKNGVTATAHCSAAMVDQFLPKLTLEALKESYDSQEENILIYGSACAGSDWTYDSYPAFATHEEIWEQTGALKEENGTYRIDLRKAIMAQLELEKYHHVLFNPADTITDAHFYSHHMEKKNLKKYGRHFAGAFYKKR